MVDIRFKRKKISDEKAYKLRIAEIKRYLESFPSQNRDNVQKIMSLIYQTKQKENRCIYLSFFSIAIAIGAFSFGLWDIVAGKIVIALSAIVFCYLVYRIILAAYKIEQLKRVLENLRKKG